MTPGRMGGYHLGMTRVAALLVLAASSAAAQAKGDVLPREVTALATIVSSEARAALPGVSTPTLSVYDIVGGGSEGPAVSAAASDLLRGALLKLGMGVLPAGATADLDLRGSLGTAADVWLLTATLWRPGGGLVAASSRSFGFPAPMPASPAAVPGAVSPAAYWSWWVTGGVMDRGGARNPVFGAVARPPSGRWDFALDGVVYRSSGHSPGDARKAGFIEDDSLATTALTLSTAYRYRLSRLGFSNGPSLAFPGAVRAAVGMTVFSITDSFSRTVFDQPNSAFLLSESGRSTTIHAKPILQLGLMRELGAWFEVEVRGELMGRTGVRQNLSYGGPSISLRVSCRFLPI